MCCLWLWIDGGEHETSPRPLYLDNQSTTPMVTPENMCVCLRVSDYLLYCQDPRVLDAMLPYLCSYYGNPHSRTHAYGWESEAAVEKARKVLSLSLFVLINISVEFNCVL